MRYNRVTEIYTDPWSLPEADRRPQKKTPQSWNNDTYQLLANRNRPYFSILEATTAGAYFRERYYYENRLINIILHQR